MVLGVPESRLEVYHPGSTGEYPDVIVKGSRSAEGDDIDLISVSAGMRLSQRKDQGKMTAWNQDGQYTEPRESAYAGKPMVHSGDRIDFFVRDETAAEQYRIWTTWVRDVNRKRNGPSSSKIEWAVEDFAMGIMGKRRVYNAFENKPIAGSDDAILNTALRNEAPEIDQALIGDVNGKTTSINCDGTYLLDLAQTLAKRAGASMRSEGTGLRFQLPENYPRYIPEKRELSGVESKDTDDGMINDVRVRGGTGRAQGDQQTTKTAYAEFSNEAPITFRIKTFKATVDRLQLWMNRQVDEGKVNVRLQAENDAGTGPVDPSKTEPDIDNKSLNFEFIDYDGFTPFDFGQHTLPEPNPWVIVETDKPGVTQRIGINDAGTPAYIVEYPYNILVENGNYDSQQRYRIREDSVVQNDANTQEEAIAIGTEVIDHESVPEQRITFSAAGKDAHTYYPGDVLELDYWREGVLGEYIITERKDTFEDGKLYSDFTAQEAGSI